jgi:GT2 family glycosyltransferase
VTANLTIVVATQNRRDEVIHTLTHLVPEAPVIVVDNGSQDGTSEAVRRCFPSVRLIRLERNKGVAARNVGARMARTPFVAFSDDDSWWDAGALDTAAQILRDHPRLALVAARTLVGPNRRLDPVSAEMAASPLPARRDQPGRPVLGFLACASVVRRDAFLKVGGFSQLLFIIGEETLLAYDLAAAGHDLSYVDTVTALHYPSTASRSGRRRLQLRNALLISWMRRPLRRAFADTVRLARTAATSADAFGALGAAFLRLPAALASRRKVPARLEHDIQLLETVQEAHPGCVSPPSAAMTSPV